MALGIKICKVCGKEYEACHTLRPNLNNEFRWKDVACCEAHGAEYLRQIMESRGKIQPVEAEPVQKVAQEAAAEAVTEAIQEPAPKKRSRKKKAESVSADNKEMA